MPYPLHKVPLHQRCFYVSILFVSLVLFLRSLFPEIVKKSFGSNTTDFNVEIVNHCGYSVIQVYIIVYNNNIMDFYGHPICCLHVSYQYILLSHLYLSTYFQVIKIFAESIWLKNGNKNRE